MPQPFSRVKLLVLNLPLTALIALTWPSVWTSAAQKISEGSMIVGIAKRPAGYVWRTTYTATESPVLFWLHVAALPAGYIFMSIMLALAWLLLLPTSVIKSEFAKRLVFVLLGVALAAGLFWITVFFGFRTVAALLD